MDLKLFIVVLTNEKIEELSFQILNIFVMPECFYNNI